MFMMRMLKDKLKRFQSLFIPDDVSETLSKVRFQTGAPLPLERINNLYTSLFNTAIREE